MLNVYFHRKFSCLIGFGCFLLVAIGGFGLARAGNTFPLLVQLVNGLVIVAMAWGIIVGFRQIWHPPLMYAADQQGIMIYYDADRVRFTEPGVFLPWALVTGMAVEKRQVSSGGISNRMRTWVIACTLKSNAPFAVQKHSVAYRPQDGEQVVCLDALMGSISRQKLLNSLRPYWRESMYSTECQTDIPHHQQKES